MDSATNRLVSNYYNRYDANGNQTRMPWPGGGYATDELWFDGQLWVVTVVSGEGVWRSSALALFPLQWTRKLSTEVDGGLRGGGIPRWKRAVLKGLEMIADGDFMLKEECRDFFAALANLPGVKVGAQELMRAVAAVAGEVAAKGYVYDGPSSPVPLVPAKFPGAASAGVSTVGAWFDVTPRRLALSQYNGAAICVRGDQWSWWSPFLEDGRPNRYGLGTLFHELLHKQMVGGGFTHEQLKQALNNVGAWADLPPRNRISHNLGQVCF